MSKRLVAVFTPFEDLADPRIERTRVHDLCELVVVALCGTIAGADTWADIERFGNDRLDWLRTFLTLEAGIPSHDTFGRVFALLDPAGLVACIQQWLEDFAVRGAVSAVEAFEAIEQKNQAFDVRAIEHAVLAIERMSDRVSQSILLDISRDVIDIMRGFLQGVAAEREEQKADPRLSVGSFVWSQDSLDAGLNIAADHRRREAGRFTRGGQRPFRRLRGDY